MGEGPLRIPSHQLTTHPPTHLRQGEKEEEKKKKEESSNSIHVKNHVPSAVFPKLQEALAAATRLKDRQQQGFALNVSGWRGGGVDRERAGGLNELL